MSHEAGGAWPHVESVERAVLEHAPGPPSLPGTAQQHSGSGRGSSAVGSQSPRPARGSDGRAAKSGGEDEQCDSDAGDASQAPKCSKPRKPHLQGRFSGRLETKQDEKRLAEECKLLGPMLGGLGKRGEKSRLTLAKIVRGIASGDVRRYCLDRERRVQELTAQLERLQAREALGGEQLAGGEAGGALLKEEPARLPGFATSVPTLGPPTLPPAIAVSQPPQPEFGMPEASAAPQLKISLPGGEGPAAAVAPLGMAEHPVAPAPADVQALANGAVQLKAQAQNFQAHAHQLAERSKQAPSEPQAAQVAVQAQSFQAKAQSLEKAAQAQKLQAEAVVHAQAQAQAQAQAHQLVAQANDHAQAYAQAAAQADHLKKVTSMGATEIFQAHEAVAAQAQHLEHEAHSHAQAQTELTVQAQSLAARAQAHAHAQAHAQAQAQQAAVEAHQLDAAAQQLQAEAQAAAAVHPMPPPVLPALAPEQDKLPMGHQLELLGVPDGLHRGGSGSHAHAPPPHAPYPLLDLHPEAGQGAVSLPLEPSQEKLGPIVSLQGSLPLGGQEMHS